MGNEELREIKGTIIKGLCHIASNTDEGYRQKEIDRLFDYINKYFNTRPEPKKEKPEGDLVEGLIKRLNDPEGCLGLYKRTQTPVIAVWIADFLKENKYI